ncbi:MAG: FAD-dependent monooxygenase [Vulcanococcus sp.]
MTPEPPAQPAMLRARVNGCGPSGALAALALARAGWAVELLDPLSSDQLLSRSRAYAISHSSRALLVSLGLWHPLAPALAPFRRLELCDRALHRRVTFTGDDLPRAAPSPECAAGGADSPSSAEAVGWILQHQPLMLALLRAVHQEPLISLRLGDQAPLTSPDDGSPDLLVAADGHHSATRAAARLRSWGFAYRQGCLTVQVRLRGSAPDQAWELFRPEGPFAVLPLGGDAYQLVWSAPLPRLRQLEDLDGAAFLDALSGALPEALQADVLLDQPRAFPVGWGLAMPLHRRGVLLLGEAAHRCHPVGGQGLNLCWRDVAVLAELARQSAAAPQRFPAAALPGRYARRRWLDMLLVLLATDALVRLFSNRQPLLLPVRRLAMALLASLPLLRRLSLSAMTDGPCRLLRS